MIVRLSAILASAFVLAGASEASAQDAAAGEKTFLKCRACHQTGETAKNGVGPKLNGLFGRKAGTVEGFNYSEANKSSNIVWSEEIFAKYIRDPKAFMPETKMVFPGLTNDKEVADVTAFLKQFDKDGKRK
jgi:cytochrome c